MAMAGPHRRPPAPHEPPVPGWAEGRVPASPAGLSPAAAPHARAGGKKRKRESTRFKSLLWREGRKLGEGDSPEGVERCGGGRRREWEGSVEDSKGTRQKPGEEARRTARAGRGVRRRTGPQRGAPAPARPPAALRPPALLAYRRHHGGQGPLADLGHHLLPVHWGGDLRGAGGAPLALGCRQL